ncbi:protein IQ-DOMAIN 1 [Iris pallida]|uniref:Protein IQ-DOMAIN 1 n=1 Tax=Iris pallida TaxID=29817 RepID=A0AAX6DN75_IRIPA|nr:protein IQ-DOMAIN 1 [Iris pallida]
MSSCKANRWPWFFFLFFLSHTNQPPTHNHYLLLSSLSSQVKSASDPSSSHPSYTLFEFLEILVEQPIHLYGNSLRDYSAKKLGKKKLMGLGGGLVKRVFSKSCSSVLNTRDHVNVRNFRVDKNRWSAVRLYLCGDELSSVLVENDLSSIKGSEATAAQSLVEESGVEESFQVTQVEEQQTTREEESPPFRFTEEEAAAATLIQSAFRGFMVRRGYEESRKSDNIYGDTIEDPSEVNEAASIEVLASDSVENFKLQDSVTVQHLVLHKSHSQGHRLKEEWDDSIASSDTLKLRIQNRLEATTRRERALAYAFSQQLRTCASRKKPTQSDSTTEPNTGWSWLERWMATRVPENAVEDCWSKQLEPITVDRRLSMLAKKRFDVSFEGKESCGSNDVSVNFEASTPRDKYDRVKSKLKTTRTVSRRKTMPEYYRPVGSGKVSKKDSSKETEKEKRSKQVQAKGTGEIKSNASQAPVLE